MVTKRWLALGKSSRVECLVFEDEEAARKEIEAKFVKRHAWIWQTSEGYAIRDDDAISLAEATLVAYWMGEYWRPLPKHVTHPKKPVKAPTKPSEPEYTDLAGLLGMGKDG